MGRYKQPYTFDIDEMPIIRGSYSINKTLLDEGHVEYVDGKTCSVFYRTGKPYCLKCDEEYRLSIKLRAEEEQKRLQQEYQQKKQKQEEKDALELKLTEATISRYLKEFNTDIDEISDAAVTTLKESINALSKDGLKLFKEACLKQRKINSYYLNLVEYEYKKFSPLKCILTGIDLDKENRHPIYYKDVEGEEIFDPVSAVVFIDKGLLEDYSKEILYEKINSILESRNTFSKKDNNNKNAYDINQEITFGRFKGQELKFIDLVRFAPNYIEWLYKNIKDFCLYNGDKKFTSYTDVLRNFSQ